MWNRGLAFAIGLLTAVAPGCGGDRPADVAASEPSDVAIEAEIPEAPEVEELEEVAGDESDGSEVDAWIAEYRSTLDALAERLDGSAEGADRRAQIEELRVKLGALETLRQSWVAAPSDVRTRLESEMQTLSEEMDTLLAELDATLGDEEM